MSVSNFPAKKPDVPATVADLDHTVVVAALARHGCNVTDAALELKVPASDLRRLRWANPGMQDQAFEVIEARLDTAEKNIHEALASDDSRGKGGTRTMAWLRSAPGAGLCVGERRPTA